MLTIPKNVEGKTNITICFSSTSESMEIQNICRYQVPKQLSIDKKALLLGICIMSEQINFI